MEKNMGKKEGKDSIIEWLRSFKVSNIALFDLIGTIVIAVIIANYLRWNPYVTVILAILLGIIVHYILGIDTELNRKLGLSKR